LNYDETEANNDPDQAPIKKLQGLREMYPNFDIPFFNVINKDHMKVTGNEKTYRMINKEVIPQGSIPIDDERLDYEDEK
jgi:hypothetical protein